MSVDYGNTKRSSMHALKNNSWAGASHHVVVIVIVLHVDLKCVGECVRSMWVCVLLHFAALWPWWQWELRLLKFFIIITHIMWTHKVKFNAPTTHIFTLPNYNPLVQLYRPHTPSQTFLHFTPRFVVPAPPSPADACCVYLPACWLCVRMAVGMNDCRYRVVLLRGIVNLSLLSVCRLSNSGLSGWVSRQPKVSSVCLSLVDGKLCLCFLAFSPPSHQHSWRSCRVCLCLVWMGFYGCTCSRGSLFYAESSVKLAASEGEL